MDRNKKDLENNPYHIFYDNYLNTNACTECTGLIHQAPVTREERDAYREIFDFRPMPADSEKKQDKM